MLENGADIRIIQDPLRACETEDLGAVHARLDQSAEAGLSGYASRRGAAAAGGKTAAAAELIAVLDAEAEEDDV